MKSLVTLSLIALSTLSLAACETSSTASNGSRQFDVAGNQGRTTVNIPANDVAAGDAPYALRGSTDGPAPSQIDQARRGTNGGY